MIATLDIAMLNTLGFFGGFGALEWGVLALIGLLLFGRRLPEVGRGLGKSIVEFRKGIQGIEEEVEEASKKPGASAPKSTEQLPSGQTRPDMVQPDSRSVSQEPATPTRPSGETEAQSN